MTESIPTLEYPNDPAVMSQYEERKDSVFGPGFRPWIKEKRRLRLVQEIGAKNKTPLIIPKIKYKLKQHWVNEMYENVDPKLCSAPRYVNEDLLVMTAVQTPDFHPLLTMLDGSHPQYPRGLNPNYRFPPKDRTLLQLAALLGDPDKVRCLLAHGADVNAVDDDRNNAMFIALNLPERYHSHKILKMLHANGTHMNHQNHQGWTALHRACVLGEPRLVERVLSFRPDVSLLNNKKMVAYELVTKNIDEIWEIFQENAKKRNMKQHICMWAHVMSQEFVEQLFLAVEPACPVCKKKTRECGKMKVENYRLWIYRHKMKGRLAKKK